MIAPISKLKIAAVQFPMTGNMEFETFLKKVEDYIVLARASGAHLIVFPEYITMDLAKNTNKEAQMWVARDYTTRYIDQVGDWSKKYNISILGGSTPRLKNGEIYNTAILAFPDGKMILQDKMFLTPSEQMWGWKAGDELQVIDAPWGRTVITICYDSEFPVISDQLASLKPELFLIPSMTEASYGFHRVRWSAQARAVEHFAFVVHTGTVGNSEVIGSQFGQASFLTPQDVGFQGIQKEGALNQSDLVLGEFDLDFLRQKRNEAGVYPARDQTERKSSIKINVVK